MKGQMVEVLPSMIVIIECNLGKLNPPLEFLGEKFSNFFTLFFKRFLSVFFGVSRPSKKTGRADSIGLGSTIITHRGTHHSLWRFDEACGKRDSPLFADTKIGTVPLKHVQDEMVTFVITFAGVTVFLVEREDLRIFYGLVLLMLRIKVPPLSIVHRHLHFRRITVIHIITAAVVISPPKILGIVNIGVMIHAVPILRAVTMTPLTAVSLLGLGVGNVENCPNRGCTKQHHAIPSDHGFPPYWLN